jgi:hypothetical protein
LAGAAVMAWRMRLGDRRGAVRAFAAFAVLFVGLLAAFPAGEMDRYKAPRQLARACGLPDGSRDIRLAAFDWFQPSMVFYSGREVTKLPTPAKAVDFLAAPTPAYLFIPESTWQAWIDGGAVPRYRIAARSFDFYRNCSVVAVTNQAN